MPELNEHYHSTFGAVQESEHIFIRNGFRSVSANPVKILEIGFGTGLNAVLTLKEAQKSRIEIVYHALEVFPVTEEIWKQLEYDTDHQQFNLLHEAPWNKEVEISPSFHLKKIKADLTALASETISSSEDQYDLVYFDAFGPAVQPEMWTEQIFRYLISAMKQGGILVTYSVKGTVKRALKAAGFSIEKLPGPAGKREMLRAMKINLK
ncbi:MAG: tRNA (5-methylaminomethyl-2-thiouridine)(34)-methyltransferase MnmD [Syntrophothermus sp.]